MHSTTGIQPSDSTISKYEIDRNPVYGIGEEKKYHREMRSSAVDVSDVMLLGQ